MENATFFVSMRRCCMRTVSNMPKSDAFSLF